MCCIGKARGVSKVGIFLCYVIHWVSDLKVSVLGSDCRQTHYFQKHILEKHFSFMKCTTYHVCRNVLADSLTAACIIHSVFFAAVNVLYYLFGLAIFYMVSLSGTEAGL